jgi:hypothetical protein
MGEKIDCLSEENEQKYNFVRYFYETAVFSGILFKFLYFLQQKEQAIARLHSYGWLRLTDLPVGGVLRPSSG